MTRTEITVKIRSKKERLALYLEREKYLLSPDAVRSYGIGKRNLERYDTDLSDVQAMIKRLEDEIAELEAAAAGTGARRAFGIVPLE